MPWETVAAFLGTYAAHRILDAGLSATYKGARLFAERFASGANAPLAERYLTMTAPELLGFYSADAPLALSLAGKDYLLPASVEITATPDGNPANQALSCTLLEDHFTVPQALHDYVKPVIECAGKDSRLFPGIVVRLAELRGHEAVLQPVDYFDGLATNFAMDHRPSARRETLREYVHGRSNSVGNIGASPLANHLGVVCMVEAADGQLIAQLRSKMVANRPATISASVSGAVNFADLRLLVGKSFGFDSLLTALFRESLEELTVDPHSISFLGLIREFLRGGKPELYFAARSKLPAAVVASQATKGEGRSELKGIKCYEFHSERLGNDDASRSAFQSRVAAILEDAGDKANFTFVTGTLLLAAAALRRAS